MNSFSDHAQFREIMLRDLQHQVFGPSLTDDGRRNEVLTVAPLQLYATGVLFPQKLPQETIEDVGVENNNIQQLPEEGDLSDPAADSLKSRRSGKPSDAGSTEDQEPLNLANEFSPSAAGISFRIGEAARLSVRIGFGTYGVRTRQEPHPRAGEVGMDGVPRPQTRTVPEYFRTDHEVSLTLEIDLLSDALPPIEVPGTDGGLRLHVSSRKRADDTLVISTMLVNQKVATEKHVANEDAYFQVEISVKDSEGKAIFLPIDRGFGAGGDDSELASMELLYRHRRAFALGHGVAGDWNRDESLSENGATDLVRSAAIPTYDLKPIRAREEAYKESNLNLSMGFFFDADGTAEPEAKIVASLEVLARDYEAWIRDAEHEAGKLDPRLKGAADANLKNCWACHARIRKGIGVLASDASAMLAFRLMNRAMLVQQVHSSRELVPPRELETPFSGIAGGYENPRGGLRKWRPFQLAFILMNISGITSERDPERNLVDLIWFPTGGGKTEAYLGLAAFTICLTRLSGSGKGTIVLMRYTLRLLTAQQFQRAAGLVMALEKARRDKLLGANLGNQAISIGLWVGKSLSPNSRADAISALNKIKADAFAPNPFQVLRCPWCGVTLTDRNRLGYRDKRIGVGSERTVKIICPDDTCEFGEHSEGLPIQVVDEDIYAQPPTIVIGTVDKFAQISWDDRVGRLFGLGIDVSPPALIIQDELHLISGPLGSIVGLYETAIDRLCRNGEDRPKIVASTATIRRAHQQCHDLYARDSFEFPPQAVRAGESYFAYEDRGSPGRLYVGVMGSAVKSHQTALVRVASPLLQSACRAIEDDDSEKRKIIDPYGTLVWYFNSLRELGHAATLCIGDIPEFLKGLCHRLNIPYELRRYIRPPTELTSRCNADEIPAILEQLEVPWEMKPKGRPPVDILLATNMIAVGVDVARLGLIIMSGQPKSTSEYIQATSRVGRRFPGLVVTVYTQTKSRDRSHYERFVAYHQSLYRFVEPTSVTPFSPQARERGMRGVIIALARLLAGVSTPNLIAAREDELREEIEFIRARVAKVDPNEAGESMEEIDDWLEFWKAYAPKEYGSMGGTPSASTLAFPFGSTRDDNFQRDAWPMLTSMRNVDGTSAARVLNVYKESEKSEGQE